MFFGDILIKTEEYDILQDTYFTQEDALKIYVCTINTTPVELMDMATLLQADIVLVEKVKDFMTAIYAISEEAKIKLAKIDFFKKLNSDVFDSAYVCMMKIKWTGELIEGNFPDVEYIETKTSQ